MDDDVKVNVYSAPPAPEAARTHCGGRPTGCTATCPAPTGRTATCHTPTGLTSNVARFMTSRRVCSACVQRALRGPERKAKRSMLAASRDE